MKAHLQTALAALIIMQTSSFTEGVSLMPVAGGRPDRFSYAEAWGVDPAFFLSGFTWDGEVRVEQTASSAPCNLVYPGEQPVFTVDVSFDTISYRHVDPIDVRGRWLLLEYALKTNGDDVFDLSIVPGEVTEFGRFSHLLENVVTVELKPPVPDRFGCWAILFERELADGSKRRLFVSSFARILKPDLPGGERFYQICMDAAYPEAVERLHTAPNRIGVPFLPQDTPEEKARAEAEYAKLHAQLDALHAIGYPVCLEFGAGPDQGAYLPLGRTRPHLDENGVMLETKSDFAWLPAYDDAFRTFVRDLVKRHGWPRGPVNGLMLWNEPWNGLSISGWGADDLRYRELYTAMCEGAEQAMAEDPELQVLLGGCDSSSNTFDKLFPDDDLRFLDRLDFLSLHYQGLAPSNPRFLRDRRHKNGRTRFWDTESWVANSQDRVPGVLAGMLAAGHDRLVGIQGNGVVITPFHVTRLVSNEVTRIRQYNAWPVAPALAAAQQFIGNRPFESLLWEGLPWVFLFRGEAPEDLTAVVCGDLAPVFDGRGRGGLLPFRTARSGEPLQGTMTLSGGRGVALYDGNGNRIAGGGDTLTVPLNDSSFYLRPDGTPGSAERMLAALRTARIDGYASPVAPALRDALRPIGDGAVFTVTLRNLLNRPVAGTLAVEAAGLTLAYEARHTIAPHAQIAIPVAVTSRESNPANNYFFSLRFDAGADGCAAWREVMHCNLIADAAAHPDWRETALPQAVTDGGAGATMMEKAWLPMVEHAAAETAAMPPALFRFAHDDRFFYLDARIPDATPCPGMPRFETRDEDAAFYPEVAREYNRGKTFASVVQTARPAAAPDLIPRRVRAPLCDQMAFTVNPPGSKGAMLLAMTFLDDDNLMRRHFVIRVKHLRPEDAQWDFEKEYRPGADAVRIGLPLCGPARIEIARLNWLKPLLAQVDVSRADGLRPMEEEEYVRTLRAGEPLPAPGDLLSCRPGEESNEALVFDDAVVLIEHRWPEGVRRFSYRRRPILPQGPGFDNVQLGFNILPDEQKRWYPAAPGTFKGYAATKETDYDFALNPIAEAYGGGTEIWKNLTPQLPDKHYYPRSPKHPLEGPVKGDARLEISRTDTERRVFLALPWAEIPEVKAARDAKTPVKLTVRVNDNGRPGACMELPCGRSVSRRSQSLKPDWGEHWATEVEFAWE